MGFYEPYLRTKMPPPASSTGSPYARAVALLSRIPEGALAGQEIARWVRYLEEDHRRKLSPTRLSGLSEYEALYPPASTPQEEVQ